MPLLGALQACTPAGEILRIQPLLPRTAIGGASRESVSLAIGRLELHLIFKFPGKKLVSLSFMAIQCLIYPHDR